MTSSLLSSIDEILTRSAFWSAKGCLTAQRQKRLCLYPVVHYLHLCSPESGTSQTTEERDGTTNLCCNQDVIGNVARSWVESPSVDGMVLL